ncbi:MAG TPA: hypothetical protein VFH51_02035 [Myxococcota bacterium]|nr:hypothetical protein [Myxococcota bacterium]
MSLPAYTPDRDSIALDVDALLSGSDVARMPPMDPNGGMMAMGAGRMSQPMNADCAPIFARLGLPFGGAAGDPSAQKVFSVVPQAAQ